MNRKRKIFFAIVFMMCMLIPAGNGYTADPGAKSAKIREKLGLLSTQEKLPLKIALYIAPELRTKKIRYYFNDGYYYGHKTLLYGEYLPGVSKQALKEVFAQVIVVREPAQAKEKGAQALVIIKSDCHINTLDRKTVSVTCNIYDLNDNPLFSSIVATKPTYYKPLIAPEPPVSDRILTAYAEIFQEIMNSNTIRQYIAKFDK